MFASVFSLGLALSCSAELDAAIAGVERKGVPSEMIHVSCDACLLVYCVGSGIRLQCGAGSCHCGREAQGPSAQMYVSYCYQRSCYSAETDLPVGPHTTATAAAADADAKKNTDGAKGGLPTTHPGPLP